MRVENVTIGNETINGSLQAPRVTLKFNDSDIAVIEANATILGDDHKTYNIGEREEINISAEKKFINALSDSVSWIWDSIKNLF